MGRNGMEFQASSVAGWGDDFDRALAASVEAF
jgi:hypothetical protein